MRLIEGNPAPEIHVRDITGKEHTLAQYRGKQVMLSFYRHAACPVCNMRVHQLIRNYPTLERQGLVILAFFASPLSNISRFVGRQNPPFPLIPDPDKAHYALYGVEEAPDILSQLPLIGERVAEAETGGFPYKEEDPTDGAFLNIPADFLINPDGTIHTAHYGVHISDNISMGKVHSFLAAATTA